MFGEANSDVGLAPELADADRQLAARIQQQRQQHFSEKRKQHIMALPQSAYKDRQFLAVIGDEVNSSSCAFTPTTADTRPPGLGDRRLARWCRSMTA